MNEGVPTLHRILSTELIADFEHPFQNWIATIKVNLALQFRDGVSAMIKSYVNTYEQPLGGVHVDGLKTGLLEVIYGDDYSPIENPLNGLSALIHVYHSDPDFIYHTNPSPRLHNPEVKNIVSDAVQLLLVEHPDVVGHLIEHFRKV